MTQPTSANLLTHLGRAFGWNLGRVVPSRMEEERLAAAGLTDPVAQRYAVWRRSILIVTVIATAVTFTLAVVDTVTSGLGEYTTFGKILEIVWLVITAALPIAALVGVARWKRPGVGSIPLIVAWSMAFLLPFVHALLPVSLLYHIQPITQASVTKPAGKTTSKAPAKGKTAAKGEEDDDEDDVKQDPPADPAAIEKAIALEEMTVEFVLSGGSYLLLLPAVLSLIPGAVNGCLRMKSLVPAAQLPGWLMVTTAPAFLLLWLVILAIVNHAARSPLLVFGVLLWAGSPALYSVFGRVFVRPQLTDVDVARIGRVKRWVGLTGLTGIGLMIAFALTTKVAGLKVVGFDRATAVSTKLDDLSDDDETSMDDVQTALAESNAVVYAFDLSSYRLVLDFLAKLLVATIIFSDLVLRATLVAWRNDRSLRGNGDVGYDTAAAALSATLQLDH